MNEGAKLTSIEAADLVEQLGSKLHKILFDETAHLVAPERWLVVGRITQALFRQHFALAYEVSETLMNRKASKTEDKT